jgi:hypothetical protein
MAPETLIEEVSPNGNIQAFVEQDDRVAHFYLWGGPESEFGTRSCWVRNLRPAYEDQTQTVMDMRAGMPPMLDKCSCMHPEGAEPLVAERLRIVWFEEGDAASLLEDGEVLAVIPSWSGYKEFSGYARDCVRTTPICWPLADAFETMQARIAAAEEYWASWGDDNAPWSQMKGTLLSAYEPLGHYSNYYAIDGEKWPPKAMLRVGLDDGIVLVTLGVSLRPQPGVESAFDEPSLHRRIELGVCLGPPYTTDQDAMQMARYVSAQSNLPWANFTWLGDGHTIPCDSLPGKEKSGFTSVLLCASPPGCPELLMPTYRGDYIRMLWLVPITDSERAFAIKHSSSALADRLWAAGCTWAYRPRLSVV